MHVMTLRHDVISWKRNNLLYHVINVSFAKHTIENARNTNNYASHRHVLVGGSHTDETNLLELQLGQANCNNPSFQKISSIDKKNNASLSKINKADGAVCHSYFTKNVQYLVTFFVEFGASIDVWQIPVPSTSNCT